jgi:mRNA interferase HigB
MRVLLQLRCARRAVRVVWSRIVVIARDPDAPRAAAQAFAAATDRPGLVPKMGSWYQLRVRVIAKRTLCLFWERDRRFADARRALQDWRSQVRRADWATPAGVKATYGDASILKDSRVVFNVCGNKYRLIAKINYPYRVVYVRFVGTHAEYDAVDSESV